MPSPSHRQRRGAYASLLDDRGFDALLPDEWREKSTVHFTPVEVVRRAAQLLVEAPGTRVLDVGAAVGKFCLVGASLVPDAHFVGVEQRPHLVQVAEGLARQLELPNVEFIHGDATELDWSRFDAFYFFNPFAEQLRVGVYLLDDTLELDPEHYLFYLHFVRERLADARIGTRVVTYHGFGASPPPGYVVVASEPVGTDRLELWVKTSAPRLVRGGGARTDPHPAI